MVELKKCPFCGSKVGMYYFDCEEQNEKGWEECDDDYGVSFPYIRCSDCETAFYFCTRYPTGKSIAQIWNKRIK